MVLVAFLFAGVLMFGAYKLGGNWSTMNSEGKGLTVFMGALAVVIIICAFLLMGVNGSNSNSSSGSKCSICGGRMKCAICGESGLYCEKSSYGSGDDHYCSKHWGDVVEWHNKK